MVIITDLEQFSDQIANHSLKEKPHLAKLLLSNDLSEIERFKIIWNLDSVQTSDLKKVKIKCKERSRMYREDGNDHFLNGDISKAKSCYNLAICYAPYPLHGPDQQKDKSYLELAYAYANRSTANFEMERYHYSLYDSMRALMLDYPDHLQYKMHERQGLCFLKLYDYGKALFSFQEARKKCPIEKKCRILAAQIADAESKLDSKETPKSTLEIGYFPIPWSNIPNMPSSSGLEVSRLSDKVILVETAGKKEFIAATDIKPGEQILVESALGFSKVTEKRASNCSHCLRCVAYLVPCRQCAFEVYCSEQCQMDAWENFHMHECYVLSAIREHGGKKLDINLTAAVNFVITSAVKFISAFNKVDGRNDTHKEQFLKRFISEKQYEAFLIGSNSSDLFSPKKLIKHGVLAAVVMKTLLQKTTLLDELSKTPFVEALDRACLSSKSTTCRNDLRADFATICIHSTEKCIEEIKEKMSNIGPKLCFYIASAIMYQTHIIQVSGRQIGELQLAIESVIQLGVGSYAQAKHLTHSCCENAMQTSYGTTIVVTAIETIRRNETVTVARCPGLTYAHMSLSNRREILKSNFQIECKCRACREQWPNSAEFMEQVGKGKPKSIFTCTKCSGHASARRPVRKSVVNSDEAVCAVCGVNKTGELTLFNRQKEAWNAEYQPFIEKLSAGTVTVDDAKRLFKSSCALQQIAEKHFRHPTAIFYFIWFTMYLCLNRMGNFFHSGKQFGKTLD